MTDPPIRHTCFGGRIGAPNVGPHLRNLLDAGLWLTAAPQPARFLGRIGARRAMARAQRWWARGIARSLGLRLDWQGLERIDPRQTYVVMPLHEGFADAIALLHLPLPIRFVARDELASWPLLGGYLRDTRQIVIRPEDGPRAYRQMLGAAREGFAAKESLVIFPQEASWASRRHSNAVASGLPTRCNDPSFQSR